MTTPVLHEDILIVIVEELHRSAPQCLRGLRLVSKQVESIVTPFVYRSTRLTTETLASSAFYSPPHKRQAAADVLKHARHLVIDKRLYILLLVKFIENMKKLESFTWSYWDGRLTLDRQARRAFFEAVGKIWPGAAIHFDDIKSSSISPEDLAALPDGQLASFQIRTDSDRTFPLQHLLVDQKNLKVLDLEAENQYFDFDSSKVLTAGQMAPLEALVLRCYRSNRPSMEWNLDRWNWSKLRHLELLGKCFIFDPTLLVPMKHLLSLQTLVVEGYPDDKEDQKAMCKRLCDIVSRAASLEKVGVVCEDNEAFVAAVKAQGSALRALHVWNFPDNALKLIGESCIQLMELTAWDHELRNGLNPFPSFGNLRRLTLFTELHYTVPDSTRDSIISSGDYHQGNRDTVQKWIRNLVIAKQGAPLEKVVVRAESHTFVLMKGPIAHRRGTGGAYYYIGKEQFSEWTLLVTWTYDRGLNGAGSVVLQEETHSFEEFGRL